MDQQQAAELSLGIDLGGTKIEGVVLDRQGAVRARVRIATPREAYDATVAGIRDLVAALEQAAAATATIGIGIPGSVSPRTGRMQNANSTWLNGQFFDRDLEAALGRPVRLANDANCFALSEAWDGGGAGARSVFGVILGTGCGGGLVRDLHVIDGPRGIGGEWGHNPLPWSEPGEHPGPLCWCGRRGCMETFVAGPALAADHARAATAAGDPSPASLTAEEIVAQAASGCPVALATLDRHASRLARGLAHVVNIFDPDVVVLGGGLSNLDHLYDALPRLMAPYIFGDTPAVDIRRPVWGDASGVRGAAWLWGDRFQSARR